MAPNVVEGRNTEGYVLEEVLHQDVKTDRNYKLSIAWPNLIFHIVMHLCAAYGAYTCYQATLLTHIWSASIGFLTSQSVVIGAHRGYSHRSYKATKPMQIFGLALQTMAGQNSTYTWVRDHRVHHKYSDTDADPHNINRGFFFAHVGWLVTKKHPLVIEKGRQIDISDLRSDKLVMFQHKYFVPELGKLCFVPLFFVLGILVPVVVPVYGWGESFRIAFFLVLCLRYVIVLNLTWCINSVAHTFGVKPYDNRIRATQSKFVAFATFGDGFHNFHHSFPWDYRSSEVGTSSVSTMLIDLLSQWGFLYDLKDASQQIVNGHKERHGDKTHKMDKEDSDRPNAKETDTSLKRLLN